MPEDHAHVCTLNSQRIFEDFPNGFVMGMKHSRRNQMIMALIFLLGSMFWSLIGGWLAETTRLLSSLFKFNCKESRHFRPL